MIDLAFEALEPHPRICVIGVGGAGGNAIANMIRNDLRDIDFVVANTDAQALRASPAGRIIQLGVKTTDGLGAGANAAIGRAAAEESLAEIEKVLEGKHMCFIAAGLGGGTGTGAAPIIAKVARDKGILTVGIVTKPFTFEGVRRRRIAELGLEELERHVDTLIVIPNQNLFRIANAQTTFKAAFEMADQILHQGVRSLTDLMIAPGHVNLDFADIRTIMLNMGRAVMGTGEASGDDRAIRAAEAAMSNPLLDDAMHGARGLIISISGGDDLRLMEVDEVASHIKDLVHPDADIIWGSTSSADLDGKIRVSVVATGINAEADSLVEPAPAAPTMSAIFEHAAEIRSASKILAEPVTEHGTPPSPEASPPLSIALAEEEAPPASSLAQIPLLALGINEAPKGEMEELLLTPDIAAPSITPLHRPEVIKIQRRKRPGPSLFERMVTAARETVTHA